MKRLAPAVLAAALFFGTAAAHIGSPDTWFEGRAGPYAVRVLVRAPGVIPGLADVVVTVQAPGITGVSASPAYWNADARGVPPPDQAKRVPGRPDTWTVPLWIMVSGSYTVRVHVTGPQGTGTAVVPVSAAATRVLSMDRAFGWVLGSLGLVLLIGAVSLVGAAVRESVLAPGATPDPRQRRRARIAMGATALLFAGLIAGGKTWWNAVDRGYRRGLDRSWEATAAVVPGPTGPRLGFTIADSVWRGRGWRDRAASPLIPDHGKLMHLFLVAAGGGSGFAHLHPVSLDSAEFQTPLPPLPDGRYRIFADVTHESGYARTLVGEVTLEPGRGAASGFDPDDAWTDAVAGDSVAMLAGGARLVWERRPPALAAGQDAGLRFTVREPNGSVGMVEPYLGMAGHAVVVRDDGAVYVHLHPMGTVSAAAAVALAERLASDTVRGVLGRRLSEGGAGPHESHPGALEGSIAFPYAFPEPGQYRIWVQVRRGGRIETGGFQVTVR